MEKFGIEMIKKAIKFAMNLKMAITKSLEDDGKITGMEYWNIAMTMPGLIPIIKNIKEIEDEFYDLDDAETKELQEYFAEEFDIPNELIELRIEKAFNLVLALIDGVSDLIPKAETNE